VAVATVVLLLLSLRKRHRSLNRDRVRSKAGDDKYIIIET